MIFKSHNLFKMFPGNFERLRNPLCLLTSALFLLKLCCSSYAQEYSFTNKVDWNELYKSVANEYGSDHVLVSGIGYEDYYLGKVGHPFLFDDRFYKGTMVFRDREYQSLDLKYDIFRQQLILYIRQNNSITWVIPPNDFISAFSLGDRIFVKFTFRDEPRFYQVVFDTRELKCLYYWSKSRYDSDHKTGYNSSKFTDSKRTTYLLVDDVLMKYNNNKSFVRLFPQKNHQMIKQYIRNNKIKVASSGEAEIAELLTYCKKQF